MARVNLPVVFPGVSELSINMQLSPCSHRHMLISNFIYVEINILVFSQSGLKSGDPYGFSTNIYIKKKGLFIFKTHIFLLRSFLQLGVLLEELRKKKKR